MRTWPSSCDAVSVICPVGGLPLATRSSGGLDAVVDTVADQMGERIRQLFEDRLVELDLPADDRHLDLFSELPVRGREPPAGISRTNCQPAASGSAGPSPEARK